MNEKMTNKEIIDATQDAVLNAASNVVNVIENTANELTGHHEPFYLSAEFWVAVAFVVAVVALVKPVGKVLSKGLKKRSNAIAKRISDAVALKEEAQKLLAEYEQKYRGAKKEAAAILTKSEREIEMIKKETLLKLDAEIEAKERDMKARLAAVEDAANKEIVDKTAGLTVGIIKKILEDSLNDKALDQLIDVSIENIKKSA